MPAEGTITPRCGLVGSPIEHSLSPVLHRAAYDALGLAWAYDAHDVPPSRVDAFMRGLDAAWRGVSVTMPHKVSVLGWCTEVDVVGRTIGAVNTLVRRADGGWDGANTDVPGMVAALAAAGVEPGSVQQATVVGAGATAAAAVYAAAHLKTQRVVVLARSPEKAGPVRELATRLRIDLDVLSLSDDLPANQLLISTIPAAAQEPMAARLAASTQTVFDVTYHPASTPLLRAAAARGACSVPGFALLLHQAVLQVELMTGCREAPIDAMRTAGQAALASRLDG